MWTRYNTTVCTFLAHAFEKATNGQTVMKQGIIFIYTKNVHTVLSCPNKKCSYFDILCVSICFTERWHSPLFCIPAKLSVDQYDGRTVQKYMNHVLKNELSKTAQVKH